VKVDEDATTYYVVTQSAAVPSATQILAGQDENGSTPIASGNFSVNGGTDTNKTITGLDDGTTYYVHFLATDGSGNQPVVETKTANTPDGTPPTATLLSPLNGAVVDVSTNTFTISFDENVTTINSAAATNADRVRLFEDGSVVETIDRDDNTVGTSGAIDADGTSNTATITFVYDLLPGKDYYILIGGNVFEDAAGNNFAGYSATTDWAFSASAVTVNNTSSNICSGSFQSIGNIVISEVGVGDFNAGASKTLTLSLANTSEFVISNSGVSVTGASADVSGLSVSVGLTSLTVTYSVSGGTVLDNITISGLKIYATGVATSTTFIRTGGSGDMDGGNGTGGSSLTYATVNVGAGAPAQTQLAASQVLTYCDGQNISGNTLTVVDQGAVNYDWYSDESLSSPPLISTSNETVNVVSDLGMTSPAVPGTYAFYVGTVGACQSAPPLEVEVKVGVNPVANAGTDKTGLNAVCPGTQLTLGGNPTLQTPSAPGTYTYSWDYVEGTSEPAADANPTYTVDNASTTATATYNFQVTVTDANGCAGTDILTVDVKPTFNISLTSPSSLVFSPSSPNQALDANPTGGVFTGVGVVQSGATTYQFSPTIAHATDPNTLPKSFNVFYTVTKDGCTRENYPIATFTISNSFFSTLQPQYCSNEYPNPAVEGVDLSVDLNGYSYLNSRKTSWNTSERFGRVPYSEWNSTLLYGYNSYVRYNSELYRCDNPSGCGTPIILLPGPPPTDTGSGWTAALKVDFKGYIANYYEGAYGGNAAPTVVKTGATYTVSGNDYNVYRFGTNENYLNCPTCNYAYPAVYLEFDQPEDLRAVLPAWVSFSYNYFGDLVTYNNGVYKCIAPSYTYNTIPDANPAVWVNVTNTNYSNGQWFHQYDPDFGRYRSGFYVNGQYVQVNKNPDVFFSGLPDSHQVCEFNVLDLDDESNSATTLTALVGSSSNLGYVQDFFVKLDGAASFNDGGGAIDTDPSTPGKAIFDSKKAFINSPGGTTSLKNVQIEYRVDPGTDGSAAQSCYGTSIVTVQVRKNSDFDFDDNIVAGDGAVYCYTEGAKGLRSIAGATVITGASGTNGSVTYSGYGVNDLANSLGTFRPGVAVDQLSLGTTTQQSIPVTATYRDAIGCQSKRTRTFKVNPDIKPSFAFGGRTSYCYEDIANAFTGHTENFTAGVTTIPSTGKYEFTFKDPGGTVRSLATVNSNNTSFTAKTFYDDIQALLTTSYPTSLNQTATIDVIYTETLNAGAVCAETATNTVTVNAPIVLDIIGLNNDDVLCRNDNTNVSQGHVVTFAGSQAGAGLFRLDDDADFSTINATLNSPAIINTTSGQGTINLSSAYNAAADPSQARQVFLQYQFTGASCTGPADIIKRFKISPPPALNFNFSASPADGEIFCYDEAPVQLSTSQNTNVSLSGYGLTDTGNGVGTFTPQLGYSTSVSKGGTVNSPQPIPITAKIFDQYGCVNVNTITYTVNPIPQAELVTGSKDYCYEDDSRTLQGQQGNSWFKIVYQGVVTPHTDNNLGDIDHPMSSITFDPKARFDDAVNNYGASALTPVKFDVYYTTADNNKCTNTLPPITLTVANQIEVKIAGMDDGDVFCSNDDKGVKTLTFNPFPADISKRRFNIGTGSLINLASPKYDFEPGLAGGDFELHYVVISGNGCTNTDTLRVKVLPSPVAKFQLDPHCDGDLIDFNADGTNNLSSAQYTWTLSDSVRTGQNIQYRFPGVSTYSIQLHVAYPAYNNDPTLVCQDSLRIDQIVGTIPKMGFNFFDVCESDTTRFVANANIPISTVAWDFGDGTSTGFGFQAQNIPSSVPSTLGKYEAPAHKYSENGIFDVVVSGKTAPEFGGCLDTDTLQVAILKNWAPSTTEPAYDMAALDGGKGFWVTEDVNGNSTWEFNVPSKTHINSNEMAWVTGATQPYRDGDVSYVNSPCFNLSGFSRPVISINHWTDTQTSDGAVMQYSVNGGQTWERLGNVASGLEWYNQLIINANPGNQENLSSGWSTINETQWKAGKHTLDVLPPDRSKVRFRVAFSSLRKNTTNVQGLDGFAFNDVVIQERNRTILAENFTNLSAINNNTAFRDFKTDPQTGVFNPAEVVKIQYHHLSGPAVNGDALNQANPVDQNARAAFYGVTTPTRAFIDGGYGQTSSNATFGADDLTPLNTYFSLRSLVTAPVDISVDFLPEPADKLNVKATVQATSSIGDPGQYNVFIAVAEQEVLGQSYVLRKLLPDASGTPLTSLSASDPAQEIMASYDMRHVTKLPSGEYAPFAVIVFVQNLETKEVLQTAIRQDGTASSNIVTGIETSSDQYIKLYPNPSDDRLNIILPSPVKAETPVRIFDTFGKQVYEGSFRIGENVKEVQTKLLSAGVYLIQLSTPQGLVRKKAMVVHE
jgi:hypothetical protein